MTSFTYYDTRFGDNFTVWLDGKTVIGIERYIGGVGGEPIRYDTVADLPQPHRHQIEEELCRKLKTK